MTTTATPARIESAHPLAPIPAAMPGIPAALREVEAEVAARFAALAVDLAPEGDALSLILTRQVASLSVRAERASRHEAAATARRVRHAAADFDEARRAEADRLFAALGDDPGNGRRLRAMPEGCDLLLAGLRTLRPAAAGGPERGWTSDHGRKLVRWWQGRIESYPAPGPELAGMIDAEIARVEAHRETLDHAALALDRAEAGERALLDATPAGVRTRRHEAATERSFFRALTELRNVRRERATNSPPAPPRIEPAAMPAPPTLVVVAAPAPPPALPAAATGLGSFGPATLPAPRPAIARPDLAAELGIVAGREPIRDRHRRRKLPR